MFKPNDSQAQVLDCRAQLCVLAGAGSGKTGTLVATILNRLADGQPWGLMPKAPQLDITKLLVLTFTDKAAAELRQRLALSFTQKRANAGSPLEEEFWRAQSSKLDRSEIGTIHAYALKIIRENSRLLGLATTPAIEQDSGALENDLNHVLIDWLAAENPHLSALLRTYSFNELKKIFYQAAQKQSGLGFTKFTADISEVPPGALDLPWSNLQDATHKALDFIENGGKINKTKAYYLKIKSNMDNFAELTQERSREHFGGQLERLNEFLARSGSGWNSGQANEYRAEISKYLDELAALYYQELARPLKIHLLSLLEILPPALNECKAKRGAINFDDILILARSLLARFPQVRQKEFDRWKLILVDEFQDTNRLQADLLAYLLLAKDEEKYDPGTPLWEKLPWAECAPRFGAFGDLKQSIYRFRGAEVEVMAGLRRAFNQDENGGKVLALTDNYRSQEPLIEFYNTLFQRLPGFDSLDAQISVRPKLYHNHPHILRLSAITPEPLGRRQEPKIELEAQALKRYLAELGDSVLIQTDSGPRPPRPGDVAVLFRRSKWIPLYYQTLTEAGWSCHQSGSQSLLDSPEVRGLLAALYYLYGLDSEINLAALLQSPLGPISADSFLALAWPQGIEENRRPLKLSAYFQEDPLPWPENLPPSDRETLAELRLLLKELNSLVGRVKVVEILELLVEKRHLLPMASQRSKVLEDSAITSLLALSRTLKHDSPNPALELTNLAEAWAPGEPDLSSTEAIKLMTVHSAKGLEFPIVIIAEADFHRTARRDNIIINAQGELALRFKTSANQGTVTPPDFDKIFAQEQKLDSAENERLLYVAATRARDHLVFLSSTPEASSAEEKKVSKRSDSWLQILNNSPKALALTTAHDYSDLHSFQLKLEVKPAANSSPIANVPFTLELLEPMELNNHTFSTTAFSELLTNPPPEEQREIHQNTENDFWTENDFFSENHAAEPNTEQASPVSSAENNSLAPREMGILFHALMEELNPLELPSDWELWVAQTATACGLTAGAQDQMKASKAVQNFLTSPLGQALSLTAKENIYREWPFRLELELTDQSSLTLTGIIDLFFQTSKGRNILVDYKMATFNERKISAYEIQLRTYAQALITAGFSTNLEAYLYFSGGEKPQIIQVKLENPAPLAESVANFKNILKNFQHRPLRPQRPAGVNIV